MPRGSAAEAFGNFIRDSDSKTPKVGEFQSITAATSCTFISQEGLLKSFFFPPLSLSDSFGADLT